MFKVDYNHTIVRSHNSSLNEISRVHKEAILWLDKHCYGKYRFSGNKWPYKSEKYPETYLILPEYLEFDVEEDYFAFLLKFK